MGEADNPNPMRLLKTLALLVFACLTLVIAAGVVTKRRIDYAWADLLVRVDAVQVETQRRATERPLLHGEPHEGEAFVHYCRAIDLVLEDEGIGRDTPGLTELLEATAEELEVYAREVRKTAPILSELRLGAHAQRAELRLDWEGDGFDTEGEGGPPALRTTTARRLSRVAFTAAVTALVEGRSKVALELMLDSLQFARDLAATPLLSESEAGGALLVPTWLETFGEQGGWALFTDEELGRWLDALAVVDDGLRTANDAVLVDTILTVRDTESFMAELPCRPVLATLLKADTSAVFEQRLDFGEEYLAAFETEPLRQPNRVRNKYEQLSREKGHDLELALQRAGDATGGRLRGLSRLRLLRVGLSRMVGREDVPPVERLGLPLQTESALGTHRVFFDTGCRNCKSGCPSIIELTVRAEP